MRTVGASPYSSRAAKAIARLVHLAVPLYCAGSRGRKRQSIFEPDGAKRDRTADLLGAIQALSQLSYGPLQPDCSAFNSPAVSCSGHR